MKDNEIAFFLAAKEGRLAEVEAFLNQGIPINLRDEMNATVLMIAVETENKALVQLLLTYPDVDLHAQNEIIGTALTFAAFSAQEKMALELLEKEERFSNADHPGALIWAVLNEEYELIDTLVAKGADVNLPGLFGLKPISDFVRKFDLEEYDTPFHINHYTKSQHTALCLAVWDGHYKMAQFLLSKCMANPNQLDYNDLLPYTMSPLQIAAESDREDIVKLLLDYGAEPALLRQSLQIKPNILALIEAKKPEKKFAFSLHI